MEGDFTQLTDEELKEKISELENIYAECLKDNMDVHSIQHVWRRIIELRHELNSRDSK